MKSETHLPKETKKLSRDERDALLLLSYRYLHYGKISEAKKVLLGLHAARPHDLTVLPLLAYAQLHCQKPKNALKIMRELKRRDWVGPEYHLLMAQILQDLGQLEEAKRHYTKYARMTEEERSLGKTDKSQA